MYILNKPTKLRENIANIKSNPIKQIILSRAQIWQETVCRT